MSDERRTWTQRRGIEMWQVREAAPETGRVQGRVVFEFQARGVGAHDMLRWSHGVREIVGGVGWEARSRVTIAEVSCSGVEFDDMVAAVRKVCDL